MAQVTLSPTADTFISSATATTNYEGNDNVDVGEYFGGTDTRRTLIKFDLSSIPSDATVTSVVLKFYDRGTDLTNNTRTCYVNRMKRNWIANQATWNVYSTGNSWSAAGGMTNSNDVELTPIGSVSMPNPPVASALYSITLDNTAIQEMVTGSFSNNGFGLSMGTESDDMHRLNSVEYATSSERPVLVVDYSIPEGGFYYMSS